MKRTKNPAKEAEYRKRAADLVAQMTLHEKVSQMLSWAPAIERLGIPGLQLVERGHPRCRPRGHCHRLPPGHRHGPPPLTRT